MVIDFSGRFIFFIILIFLFYKVCKIGFIDWINRDRSEFGNGDYEVLIDVEKADRCLGGFMTRVECYVEAGDISFYSLGEVFICDVVIGFICNNVDNFLVICIDYKIRYYC